MINKNSFSAKKILKKESENRNFNLEMPKEHHQFPQK